MILSIERSFSEIHKVTNNKVDLFLLSPSLRFMLFNIKCEYKNAFLYLQKSTKNKVVTGYILYSREVRKQVVQNNPESTFGDISRIVGSEWKSLPSNEKQMWEERASKLNEENKAALSAAAGDEQCASPAQPPGEQVGLI